MVLGGCAIPLWQFSHVLAKAITAMSEVDALLNEIYFSQRLKIEAERKAERSSSVRELLTAGYQSKVKPQLLLAIEEHFPALEHIIAQRREDAVRDRILRQLVMKLGTLASAGSRHEETEPTPKEMPGKVWHEESVSIPTGMLGNVGHEETLVIPEEMPGEVQHEKLPLGTRAFVQLRPDSKWRQAQLVLTAVRLERVAGGIDFAVQSTEVASGSGCLPTAHEAQAESGSVG